MNPETNSALDVGAPAPGIEEVPVGAEVTPDGQVVYVPKRKTPMEVLQSPPVMCPPPIPAKDNEYYLHAVRLSGRGGAYLPAIYVPPHRVKLGDPEDTWKQIDLAPGQVVSFDQKAADVPKVIGVALLDGYWLTVQQKMVYADPRAACLTRMGVVEKVGFWCPHIDGIPNSPHHEEHGPYVGFVKVEVDDPKNPGEKIVALEPQEPDRYQQDLIGQYARPGVCVKCAGRPEKQVQAERKIRSILERNKYAQNQAEQVVTG